MLRDTKSIHQSVVYAILAGAGHALSRITGDSMVFGSFVFIGAWVFTGAAGLSLLEYLTDWIGLAQLRKREADSISREAVLAGKLAGLDHEGLTILKDLLQSELLDESGPGAYYMGNFIPDSFVRDVIAQSTASFLVPERVYSEGSNARRWYKSLALFLISEGVAEPAAGNRPVRIRVTWREIIDTLGKAKSAVVDSRLEYGEN